MKVVAYNQMYSHLWKLQLKLPSSEFSLKSEVKQQVMHDIPDSFSSCFFPFINGIETMVILETRRWVIGKNMYFHI